MRITKNPSFSWETLELVSHDGQYEYDGPVVELKGSGYAKANMNTANNLQGNYSSQGQAINASLIPEYQSEIENPIGFGQQALTEMKTEGGQAAAGAQSAAQQRAALAAARTGNLASLPAIQDKLARSATASSDENALGLDVENTKAKLAQQQAGLSGEAALGAEDTGAGLNALGLSNQALNEYMQAANWWEQPLNSIISGGSQVGAAGAYGAAASGAAGCYVAAAIFGGWHKPETQIVRKYIYTVFAPKNWLTRAIIDFYSKHSARMAQNPWIVKLLSPIFRLALRKALNG